MNRKFIVNQIDSAFDGYQSELKCDKERKILSVQCTDNNMLQVKTLTHCNDIRYFYFDHSCQLVRVVRQLETSDAK